MIKIPESVNLIMVEDATSNDNQQRSVPEGSKSGMLRSFGSQDDFDKSARDQITDKLPFVDIDKRNVPTNRSGSVNVHVVSHLNNQKSQDRY